MTVRPGPGNLKLSRNVDRLSPPVLDALRIAARKLRAAGEDVLDLAFDDPRVAAPRTATEAALKAIQHGKSGPAPESGILELRVAIARHLSLLSGGRPVNADNIVVTNGARQALFSACFTLFDSSDEVLVPSPTWHSFSQIVALARAKPIPVAGDVEWSLKVGVDQLNRASTPDTAGVVLCTPVNPTGAVYTRAEIKAIVEWALDKGRWVVCDEVYRRMHFGSGPAPSVLDLSDELLERVVLIGGASKTHGADGWRLGFALARNSIVRLMTALQSHVTGEVAHPTQWACVAAYSDERAEAELEMMVDEVRRCRDVVVGHFRRHMPGIEYVEPLGGIHLFFRVDGCFHGGIRSASDYCERLLVEKSVMLAPGVAFGDERWVRLSYACPERDLVRALERIGDWNATLTGN